MRMHCNLRGAAKQEAQPNSEDSTFGDLPTVGYVHISSNALQRPSYYIFWTGPALLNFIW